MSSQGDMSSSSCPPCQEKTIYDWIPNPSAPKSIANILLYWVFGAIALQYVPRLLITLTRLFELRSRRMRFLMWVLTMVCLGFGIHVARNWLQESKDTSPVSLQLLVWILVVIMYSIIFLILANIQTFFDQFNRIQMVFDQLLQDSKKRHVTLVILFFLALTLTWFSWNDTLSEIYIRDLKYIQKSIVIWSTLTMLSVLCLLSLIWRDMERCDMDRLQRLLWICGISIPIIIGLSMSFKISQSRTSIIIVSRSLVLFGMIVMVFYWALTIDTSEDTNSFYLPYDLEMEIKLIIEKISARIKFDTNDVCTQDENVLKFIDTFLMYAYTHKFVDLSFSSQIYLLCLYICRMGTNPDVKIKKTVSPFLLGIRRLPKIRDTQMSETPFFLGLKIFSNVKKYFMDRWNAPTWTHILIKARQFIDNPHVIQDIQRNLQNKTYQNVYDTTINSVLQWGFLPFVFIILWIILLFIFTTKPSMEWLNGSSTFQKLLKIMIQFLSDFCVFRVRNLVITLNNGTKIQVPCTAIPFILFLSCLLVVFLLKKWKLQHTTIIS